MANIKCWHCKGSHGSVADVKACAGTGTQTATPNDSPTYSNLSGGQQRYLADLLDQLHCELDGGLTPETISYTDGQPLIRPLSDARSAQARGASYSLPRGVVQIPVKSSKRAEREPTNVYKAVPHGYYATTSRTGNNDLDFWFVNRPETGQWAGRTFVKRVIGGQGNQHIQKGQAYKALRAILAEGIEVAGNRFADELGRCCRCGKHLTDDLSRQRRKGPDCWAKAS